MSEEQARTPGNPIKEMRVALTTGDYERMMKLYRLGLGLEPAALWSDEGKAAIFDMARATLEIFDEEHAEAVDRIEAGKRTSGQIRFAFEVPDLQAAMERLLAHGATLVHEPIVTPWGHHNVRLQDPDGLQITLFQVLDKSKPEFS
jgi:catechol 2,3-dioxygenase-like lactoylglutathione lyase family enzyme